jgi:heat shock protein HslJ
MVYCVEISAESSLMRLKLISPIFLLLLLAHCSDKPTSDEPPSLTGPDWQLTALVNIKGGQTALGAEVYTAQFSESGAITGRADCNSYFAEYDTPEAGVLEVSALATTYVYCGEESLMEQYYAGLQAAHSFELSLDQLALYFADEGKLIFVPQETP